MMPVFEGLFRPVHGLVMSPNTVEPCRGNHAVLICGWICHQKHGDVFVFRNSWGKDWGDDGYGYLSEDYVARFGKSLGHVDVL